MKTIFATLLLAFAFAANAGIPHLWNNGSTFTFDYWNNSERDERCSGPVYLELEDNSRDTVHIHEFVWARRSAHRTYYPNTIGKRIVRLSHAVWCF